MTEHTTPPALPSAGERAAVILSRRDYRMRYGAALLLVVLAFTLRISLLGSLDNRLPFAFFLPAAMIAAWYGGLGPGLLAAALGLLIGDYFFLAPHHAFGPLSHADRTAIAVYAISSSLAVFLLDNLHTRIRLLECALRRDREARAAAEQERPRAAMPGRDPVFP